MRTKLLLYTILCLLALPAAVYGQAIKIDKVDASAYPTITAEISVLGKDGFPINTISTADFSLSINNTPTTIQSITCPPPEPPLPMWAVIACDRSQSMNERISDDLLYIDLATAGMSAFVKAVDFTAADTRVALMVFDTAASVIVNFSTSAVVIGTQVGGIQPIEVAGTNYNRAFLDPFEGAITLLKRVPPGYERVLVLISDGAPTAGDFDYNTIKQEVLDNHIVVYPLIIKEAPSYQLQQLAFLSGGKTYGGLVNREEMRTIYTQIAKSAQFSKKPCKISWKVDVCDTNHRNAVNLRYGPLNLDTAFVYTINAPIKQAKVSAGRDTSICSGMSVVLRATGSSATGTYQWFGDGLDNPSIATPTVTPTTTTTYSVVFRDDRGCTATDTVLVKILSPQVDIPVDSLFICRGESTTISATGNGERYSWAPANGLDSPPPTTPVVTVHPTATTTYYITASIGACTARDSITVVVTDLLNALDLGADRAICPGGSTTLTPVGIEGRYYWRPAEGLDQTDIRTPVASPEKTTTYYLTVTTASGCSASDSIVVTVYPRAVVDAGADSDICPGKSTPLEAKAQEGTFEWSPATGLDRTDSRIVTASPLQTTKYTVLYTDLNGCTAKDSVTVLVNGALVIKAGSEQAMCPGGSVQLAVSGSGGTALWTPATGLSSATSRTPVASPSATTMYKVVVTSPEGCIGIDSVKVVVHPKATVDAGNGAVICRGGDATLHATGSEGTYAWLPATGLDNPASPNPIATPSTTTKYTVTVTDINGCTATDDVTITVRPYAKVHFSLERKKQGIVKAGVDDELIISAEGIDITQDTLMSFECVFSYNMESLQYRSLSVGDAATGWNINAIEQLGPGLLVVRGTGVLMKPGEVCTLVMRPYLSAAGTKSGDIPIEAVSVEAEAKGCITTTISGTKMPVEQPCISSSRAIRYTGKGFALKPNTPNPATQDGTTIEFSIALDGHTSLVLYNSFGEQVMVLANEVLESGTYTVSVPTNTLTSGRYYYRLISGPYTHTQQMVINK